MELIRRDGKWYVVKRVPDSRFPYDTTHDLRVLVRVPVSPWTPRETAEGIARQMGF